MDSSPLPHHPGGQDSEGLTCRDTKGPPCFGGERLRGAPQTGPPPAAKPLRPALLSKAESPFYSLPPRPPRAARAGRSFQRVSQKIFKEHKTRSRLGCLRPKSLSLAGAPGWGGKRGRPARQCVSRPGSHRRLPGPRPSRRGTAGRHHTAAPRPRSAGRARRARGAARRAGRSRSRRCRRRSPPRRRSASPGARTRRCRTRSPRGRRAALRGRPC